MLTARNPDLARLLRPEYDAESLDRIVGLLESKLTLAIPVLPNGVFSAATVSDFSQGTNYHAAWVRDNVHVAYAHFVNGKPRTAVRAAKGLAAFFKTQYPRFDAVIADPSRKFDVMNRPHIRFDGDCDCEIGQKWAHAQNDALGYFVWLYATLALEGALPPEEWDLETLGRFPAYFRAIEFWEDEDSGHWEEILKVAASSIGPVVAGLRRLRELAVRVKDAGVVGNGHTFPVPAAVARMVNEAFPIEGLDTLIENGEAALFRILPNECVDPDPRKFRPYDAALLFLVYPLGVVNGAMAETIVERTEAHLRGEVGIKRYLGDSFYCNNYESEMARRNDDPTRDFSHDLSERDALLAVGGEAQWCLFDPIVSVYFGHLYQRTRAPEALHKQTEYLNRALAQVSCADPPRCDEFRCPELYYVENGRLQTSKVTPLLWTQANLWTALETMRRSSSGSGSIP